MADLELRQGRDTGAFCGCFVESDGINHLAKLRRQASTAPVSNAAARLSATLLAICYSPGLRYSQAGRADDSEAKGADPCAWAHLRCGSAADTRTGDENKADDGQDFFFVIFLAGAQIRGLRPGIETFWTLYFFFRA